jgi:hypothetical protein
MFRRVLALLAAAITLGALTVPGAAATTAGKSRLVITESGTVYPLGGSSS